MKKLPPLRKVTPINGMRVDVRPPDTRSARRYRPPAVVKASVEEFKEHLATLGQEKTETDKKIAEMMPQIERMREIQDVIDRKGQHLSVEEQTIILEAHFSRGIGPKAIADILKRPHSTVVRFIQRYTSTAPIAQATMRAGAEILAKRIIKNANVGEALEVLDRVDALPKKDRAKAATEGPRFNIIVAMPGSTAAIPAPPDQALIEAEKV